MNNAKPDGGVILNRVVSLLLTGIAMAIFGQANKNSNITVKQSANSNINSMPQTNKRKKCSSCNGKNCATCIKI